MAIIDMKPIVDPKTEVLEAVTTIENTQPDHPDAQASPEERAASEKRLLRKIDYMLIPWLMILYLCSFLDRTNIGNARILGLEDELNITGGQYNTALAVFFISYSLFEAPSNVLLKRFPPRFWISFIVIGFGSCCLAIGFVRNYGGLVAARFLLGVFEAGLFPGSQFYLSCWYRRNEFGVRSAIFSSAASAAGSFGGLLAAGIAQMDGIGGYSGWRWIFIVEGAVTICLGLASVFLIQEWPDKAKFLDKDDRLRMYYRLKEDQQASAEYEGFRWAFIREAFKDPKTYTMMIIKMGNGCSLYAVSLTLPTIVRQLGFTATTAQLLTVPPYFVAMVFTIGMSWIADRIGQRGYCTLATSGTGVIGFILLMSLESVGGRYFALYLVTAAIYPCVPLTIAWTTNNVEGMYKRGVVIGIILGWSNIQGVVGSNVYQTHDAPRFLQGYGICLGYLFLFLFFGTVLHRWYLVRENTAKLAGQRDYLVVGKTEAEIAVIGDRRPDFLYKL